jgi:hypothetical protein
MLAASVKTYLAIWWRNDWWYEQQREEMMIDQS